MDKTAQRQGVRFLSQFELIYLTQADQEWAIKQHLAYRLSQGVNLTDCLIAAPGYRLQLPLYTQNLKHFAPLLGQLAHKPY